MGQEEIDKAYEMFAIPESERPVYKNAFDFASGFKKFTLLKDFDVTYSNTSLLPAEAYKREF